MTVEPRPTKSILGRRLGVGGNGQMVANGIDITSPAADATITIGDEAANVRIITIQLLDAHGVAVDYAEVIKVFVFSDATKQALATGGSTGLAISTDGTILITQTAKLIFEMVTESDGALDLTWTDTGTESVVLGVVLPTGRMVLSDAIANAA